MRFVTAVHFAILYVSVYVYEQSRTITRSRGLPEADIEICPVFGDLNCP